MSVVYRNKYRNYDTCGSNGSAVDAQRWAELSWDSFERVEMHINGHWHRPPVGIREEQCSHAWKPMTVGSVEDAEIVEVLVPQ